MRKIQLIIYFICISVAAVNAQTTAHTTTTSFTINGLKVIFKPTVKEVISVRMYYRGGVYNYPAAQAGIESFALKGATICGTKNYNADAFRDMSDKYGIAIGGSSTYDYGNIEMECISKYFNEGWSLFAEAVNNPVFEDNEVALLKNKLVTQANGQQSDPDKYIDDLLSKNAFAGTPYATDPDGDEKTISAITTTQLKQYYSKIFNRNRMFLVVAGKITRQQLEQKIKAAFAALPAKPYTEPIRHTPIWSTNKVSTEGRQLATNYISTAFNSPAVNSPDFLPFRMGMSALSGSLFAELRTRRNLSYDPGAYLEMRLMPFGVMHISTNDPKEAATAMVTVLNRLRAMGISPAGLKYLKSGFITSNYIKQQGSGAITSNLGTAEINGGWQYAETLPQQLSKITVNQINTALNQYISGLRWSYLGNPNLANQAADAFNLPVH